MRGKPGPKASEDTSAQRRAGGSGSDAVQCAAGLLATCSLRSPGSPPQPLTLPAPVPASSCTPPAPAPVPQPLLSPAAPVPPPGTGRGGGPGEEGWSRGKPASDSGFASPGQPRSETPARWSGGQTCCLISPLLCDSSARSLQACSSPCSSERRGQ